MAFSQKFRPPQKPFQSEIGATKIAPHAAGKRKFVRSFLEDQVNRGQDVDESATTYQARVAGASFHLAEVEKELRSSEYDHQFLEDFHTWLMGRGQGEDHERTRWGRTPAYDLNDQVREYLLTYQRARMSFIKDLAELAHFPPRNLEEYYLYFKYIVRGHPVEDGLDFLEDWQYMHMDKAYAPPEREYPVQPSLHDAQAHRYGRELGGEGRAQAGATIWNVQHGKGVGDTRFATAVQQPGTTSQQPIYSALTEMYARRGDVRGPHTGPMFGPSRYRGSGMRPGSRAQRGNRDRMYADEVASEDQRAAHEASMGQAVEDTVEMQAAAGFEVTMPEMEVDDIVPVEEPLNGDIE